MPIEAAAPSRAERPLDRALAAAVRSRNAQPQAAALATPVLQRYIDHNGWRWADDLSVVTKQGSRNHEMYARKGKAAVSNSSLKANRSQIELSETATKQFSKEGKPYPLEKIEPKNVGNGTSGDSMQLVADCGESCAAVVGSPRRRAEFSDEGATKKTAYGAPSQMKSEIMRTWLTKERTRKRAAGDSTAANKIYIALYAGWWYEDQALKLAATLGGLSGSARDAAVNRYWAILEAAGEAYFGYYYGLPPDERAAIDKDLKINKWADPSVGEGFTTSSGGPPIPGKTPWNFHWAGIVMTSDSGNDKIVLENYAHPVKTNNYWTFEMYGTKKPGQSFHERHTASQLHGQIPATMKITK